MWTLIVLTLLGSGLGCIGGAIAGGLDSVLLGGAIGMIGGVSIWAALSTSAQLQRERRLNRYFHEHVQMNEHK